MVLSALLMVARLGMATAASVTVEVEDSALRLRTLYNNGGHIIHVLHHIDLLTAPLTPRTDDYHAFSAELTSSFGALAFGALRLEGVPQTMYRPLNYSPQSTHHYRTGTVRAYTQAARASRNGVALSYHGPLQIHLFGYKTNEAHINVFVGAVAQISELILIEQWNSVVFMNKMSVDDSWFRDRAYFVGAHLYAHALKFHLLFESVHPVCTAFVQHSTFHIPQYAVTCAVQIDGDRYSVNGFAGLQSEYYTDDEGKVLDEWLLFQLRYIHDITNNARLTVGGEGTFYKPEHYYRRVTFNNSVPEIFVFADWEQEFQVAPNVIVGYGGRGDFLYDWRKDAEYRARVRLTPRTSLEVGPFLFRGRVTAIYGESQWQEVSMASDATIDIGKGEVGGGVDYTFDLRRQRHTQLDVQVSGSYSFSHLRIYGKATFKVLQFSGIDDVNYEVGVRLST